MNHKTTNRRPGSKSEKPHCVQCGSSGDIEHHHAGGRNHVPWFTVPFCRKHHVRLTAAIRLAGVNMSFTSNNRVRLLRALMAIVVLFWTLLEELLQEIERQEK
jgi:hypothetical protein